MSEKVFVFGSSKETYIPYTMRHMIRAFVEAGRTIFVGDAPGIDTSVQEYLSLIEARDVVVYTTHEKPRFIIPDMDWNVVVVDTSNVPEESREQAKDIVMCNDCDRAICAILTDGSRASRRNIAQLEQAGKDVMCFYL